MLVRSYCGARSLRVQADSVGASTRLSRAARGVGRPDGRLRTILQARMHLVNAAPSACGVKMVCARARGRHDACHGRLGSEQRRARQGSMSCMLAAGQRMRCSCDHVSPTALRLYRSTPTGMCFLRHV